VRPRPPCERLLLIALASIAMWCGSLPGSWAAGAPLEQLGRILELRPLPGVAGSACHGTPIGIMQILTADHCVGSGVLEFVGQERADKRGPITGQAHLLWRDPKRDLAMLQADVVPGWAIVPISKRPLAPLDHVYWRRYIPRRISAPAAGTFDGIDSEGNIALTGPTTYGASGSGVLNEAGELVGVMHVVYNPATVGKHPRSETELLSMLYDAVRFMPASGATPVSEWPKPR
jgi:hypothetical protein